MLAVAVGGFDGGLVDILIALSQHVIGDRYALKLREFRYADQLFEAAHRHRFDLFIVLLNPTLAYSAGSSVQKSSSDFAALGHLKSVYRKPLVVVHNGCAGYSAEAMRQAGADAVFGMPFDTEHFLVTLRNCLRVENKS